MTNLENMPYEEIKKAVKNTHLVYSEIINGLENGTLVPIIQAKHQRVYIRKAIPGEKIFVKIDNASYTATDGQWVVYNDAENAYLVNEKGFKKYEIDKNMPKRIDKDGFTVLGFKPKGAPVLTIQASKIKALNLEEQSFTYFPSNWWGALDTVEKDFMFVLPYNPAISLKENLKDYKEKFVLFPKPTVSKEEILKHLTSGEGFDCYAISGKYVSTYGICDANGTFKEAAQRNKAGQKKEYLGQPDFPAELKIKNK